VGEPGRLHGTVADVERFLEGKNDGLARS